MISRGAVGCIVLMGDAPPPYCLIFSRRRLRYLLISAESRLFIISRRSSIWLFFTFNNCERLGIEKIFYFVKMLYDLIILPGAVFVGL